MAANYWDSTQARYWTFTRTQMADMQDAFRDSNRALNTKIELPEPRHVNIFLQQQMFKLGRRLNLRQQVLATAQIFVRRFYIKVEIRRTNPYLVMTTAIYLACKMEECPIHIRFMLTEAARHWPELGVSDASKIGECEFHLISTLSSRLIVHHPYRTLQDLSSDLDLTTEEAAIAGSIINDHYNIDLPFLYPPHIIAVTAIFLAVVLRPPQSGLQAHSASSAAANATGVATATAGQVQQAVQQGLGAVAGTKPHHAKIMRIVEWLAETRVDMDAVIHATQDFISLYEVWESYTDRPCKEAFTRILKENPH